MAIEWIIYDLLKAAVAGAAAGAVISLLMLYWEDICVWFQARSHLVLGTPENVAFSLQQRINNGNYRSIYGVFDTWGNRVVESKAVISSQVDSRPAAIHRDDELVIIRS